MTNDPSGIDMSRDIGDRNRLFGNMSLEFKRLALNMNQIEEFNPPPNPTKVTDSRASGYISNFGYECWELDALEPRVISKLISENVCKYRDAGKYLAVKEREAFDKDRLNDVSDNWALLMASWNDIKEDYC